MYKTRTPHKHAELIKAWADGAEIEIFSKVYQEWIFMPFPDWHNEMEYRIKPEPKPDVFLYGNFASLNYLEQREKISGGEHYCLRGMALTSHKTSADNIRVTYDGETGRLKAVELLLDYIETFVA